MIFDFNQYLANNWQIVSLCMCGDLFVWIRVCTSVVALIYFLTLRLFNRSCEMGRLSTGVTTISRCAEILIFWISKMIYGYYWYIKFIGIIRTNHQKSINLNSLFGLCPLLNLFAFTCVDFSFHGRPFSSQVFSSVSRYLHSSDTKQIGRRTLGEIHTDLNK